MMPLMLCKKADAHKRGKINSLVTNRLYSNRSASRFTVNHKAATLVLAVDNHQCIHDSNAQPETLRVTVVARKDTLNQYAGLSTWMISLTITQVTISSTGELSFLNTIFSEVAVVQGGSQPWTGVLDLNSSQTEFKIDTGADVTVIPEHVYNESRDGPLSSTDRILCGPSRHSLQVLGKFLATLQKNQLKTNEEINVVKELQKALACNRIPTATNSC